MNLNRRRLLALAGTAVTASAAGCSGGDGSDGNDGSDGSDSNGGATPDDSGSATDGADDNSDGQGTGSSGDEGDSEDDEPRRQNIEEGAEEFDNYTRTSYLVEVFEECGETLEYANWIGPNGGEIGIALGVVGRNGCDVVSRESETYDEETQTLTLELDISPLEGATCEDDCMVQNDVIVGYQFPVDVMEDLNIDVFVSEDGGEPELRAEYPFEN
mgnify:CR=1 FL=1